MPVDSKQEQQFKPMRCRRCGNQIEPNAEVIKRLRAEGKGLTAHLRRDCIWQCSCGVVYSNAVTEANRVMIVERPESNVPKEVQAGLGAALDASANQVNLENKRAKFCYETSEDAVTWTLFQGLQQLRRLDIVPAPWAVSGEPQLLLWGASTSTDRSREVERALQSISLSLGETPNRRSEPDVILVWDNLVVFVEAKYRSSNDRKPAGYSHFGRYFDRPELFAVEPAAIRTAGYYELTRNWRIGVELGERFRADRFLLINLGPSRLASSAGEFAATVHQSETRWFLHRTWRELVDAAGPLPDWLSNFAQSRRLREG